MWNVESETTAGEERGLTPPERAIDRNAPYKRIATEEAWNIPEILEAQVRLLESPAAPNDTSLRMAGMFSKLTSLQEQLMNIGAQRLAAHGRARHRQAAPAADFARACRCSSLQKARHLAALRTIG
jgi:hypothetical protein